MKKNLPVSKELKPPKVDPGKEGVNIQNSDSMEMEQGRKVKPMVTSGVRPLANSTGDLQTPVNNSIHHRKRERTPSPTPSLPGSKRRAKSPSYLLTNSTTNDTTGQPSNPKIAQPPNRLLMGANSSLKLPGAVRLVKPEMSSASKVLTEEIQKQQGQENARLRTLIFKEVKKLGKSEIHYTVLSHCVCTFLLYYIPTLSSHLSPDYSPQTLFQHLEGVKGSVEVRRGFVQEVIREATKFKRKPLIQQLEEWAERLPSFKTSSAGGGSLKPKPRTERR